MIVCRTPFRISLFGGGSDYPAWLRYRPGCVLSTTIDKYCYLTCRYLPPFFDHKIRIVYSKVELCKHPSEIMHPAVRAAIRTTNTSWGIELHHDGDLPARSGMGSSSAFAVGALNALWTLQGKAVAKKDLALGAINLEQKMLKEHVGCQDQVAAAYGGINTIHFFNTTDFSVEPVPLSKAREAKLLSHLLLIYTGTVRNATDIAQSFLPSLPSKRIQIERFIEMVSEAKKCLVGGNILDIGTLLDEAWNLKKSLGSKISNTHLDNLYLKAKQKGAIGGKILGAGGGGFLLLFAKPENHLAIIKSLPKTLHVPFSFDKSGSQILVYDNQINFDRNPL